MDIIYIQLFTILRLEDRDKRANIRVKNERRAIIMFYVYDDVLTVEELCELLKIGKNTAYRLLQEGQIQAIRIGRIWKIPKVEVVKYLTGIDKMGV